MQNTTVQCNGLGITVSWSGLRVSFINGYTKNATASNGHLEPGMAVLTKPLVIETLGLRIREIIARG